MTCIERAHILHRTARVRQKNTTQAFVDSTYLSCAHTNLTASSNARKTCVRYKNTYGQGECTA